MSIITFSPHSVFKFMKFTLYHTVSHLIDEESKIFRVYVDALRYPDGRRI